MRVRFFLDENLSPRLKPTVLRHNVHIDVIRVGDEGAPPLGTADPAILIYVETAQRLLITNNRKSMPVHVAEHLTNGGHHWGVLRVRRNVPIREIVEEIVLIWEASEADEWLDRSDWIPL